MPRALEIKGKISADASVFTCPLGWWPLYKKEGDYLVKTGNIRMELEVMNKEQSEKRPAGFGRNEPNANPVIPEPM